MRQKYSYKTLQSKKTKTFFFYSINATKKIIPIPVKGKYLSLDFVASSTSLHLFFFVSIFFFSKSNVQATLEMNDENKIPNEFENSKKQTKRFLELKRQTKAHKSPNTLWEKQFVP